VPLVMPTVPKIPCPNKSSFGNVECQRNANVITPESRSIGSKLERDGPLYSISLRDTDSDIERIGELVVCLCLANRIWISGKVGSDPVG